MTKIKTIKITPTEAHPDGGNDKSNRHPEAQKIVS